MCKIISFFIIISFLFSCSSNPGNDSQTLGTITVSGKIDNHVNGKKIELSTYLPGFGQMKQLIPVSDSGEFSVSFDSYFPASVNVFYKNGFTIIATPASEVYVVFDGEAENTLDLLKTVAFVGDDTKDNEEIIAYQIECYYNPTYYDTYAKDLAIKEYDANRFITYLEGEQRLRMDIYNQFVNTNSPSESLRNWALAQIEQLYINDLSSYPQKHIRFNNLNAKEWDVPSSYYQRLENRLALDSKRLLNGQAVQSIINTTLNYVNTKLSEEPSNKQYYDKREQFNPPQAVSDSLTIEAVSRYVKDDLLNQMVLSEIFNTKFISKNTEFFDKYRDIAREFIIKYYLLEPLSEKYRMLGLEL